MSLDFEQTGNRRPLTRGYEERERPQYEGDNSLQDPFPPKREEIHGMNAQNLTLNSEIRMMRKQTGRKMGEALESRVLL